MQTALVIGNASDNDPGFIGERLVTHGYDLVTAVREDHPTWDRLDADLVLVLGSEWSVYWDHVAPAVAAEQAVLAQAAADGVPVFGICFGAQILTTVLGGHVERSPIAEVGWHSIESSLDAIDNGPWFQWHYDVCRPGSGVEVLAANAVGPQAFRAGSVFATQFHPEVDRTVIARWAGGEGGSKELARLEIARESLDAQTDQFVDHARLEAHRLVDWFVAEFT